MLDSFPFPGSGSGSAPTSAALDTSGNLWACVSSVVYKFDGSSWQNTNVPPSNFTSIFRDDSLNVLYFIENNSTVYRYDGTYFTLLSAPVPSSITYLFTDKNRNYWLKASGGYYRFDGINFTFYPDSLFPIQPIAFNVDSLGHFWIGGMGDSLFEYDGTTWIAHNISNNIDFILNDFQTIAVNSRNEVWAGDHDGNVYSLNNISATYRQNINFAPWVSQFDRSDNYWICQYSGSSTPVARFDGLTWTNFSLPSAFYCIAIDTNNVVYVGGVGISHFNGSQWISIPNPLVENNIIDLVCDRNNIFYFTDGLGNIGRYDGVNVSYISMGGFSSQPRLYVDHFNHLWAFVYTNEYKMYDGLNWTNYPLNSVIPSFYHMQQDNHGDYWLVTQDHLIRTDWLTDTTVFDLPAGGPIEPTGLVIDRANNKWISGLRGIFVFNEHGIFTSPLASSPQKVSGNVFSDVNQNGIRDTMEYGLQSQKILVMPDSICLYTASNGSYNFFADSGQYQLDYILPSHWMLTSDSVNYHIHLDSSDIGGLDFGTYPTVQMDSFSVEVFPGTVACFGIAPVWITYGNRGTYSRDVSIYLIVDSSLIVSGSFPPFSYQSGDTVRWDFNNLRPFESGTLLVDYTVPGPGSPNFMDSTSISFQVNLSYNNSGSSITYLTSVYEDTILCSFDPNDKSCRTYSGLGPATSLFGDPLLYTIRFQNTGNSPATNILIMDTLDLNLIDLNSFELVGSSHPVSVQLASNGVVQFRFDNIMLPDSTINYAGSQGFVAYRVRSVLTNSTYLLHNSAHIFFDLNPAIATNTTETILTTPTSSESLLLPESFNTIPNPFHSTTKILFENRKHENCIISIFDVNGKLFYQSSTCNNYFNINTENWHPGMYLFTISGGQFYSGKIIKE